MSRVVEVSVLRDGMPEPREPVQTTVTASAGALLLRQEVAYAIPRHGYAVSDLRLSASAIGTGEVSTAHLTLNAPVPADAQGADIRLGIQMSKG